MPSGWAGQGGVARGQLVTTMISVPTPSSLQGPTGGPRRGGKGERACAGLGASPRAPVETLPAPRGPPQPTQRGAQPWAAPLQSPGTGADGPRWSPCPVAGHRGGSGQHTGMCRPSGGAGQSWDHPEPRYHRGCPALPSPRSSHEDPSSGIGERAGGVRCPLPREVPAVSPRPGAERGSRSAVLGTVMLLWLHLGAAP